MLVKEIVASRSCRMNLGNYEGLEHFISMKAEVDELDDVKAEQRRLNELVDAAMLEQLDRSYRARGKSMTRAQIVKHHGLAPNGD